MSFEFRHPKIVGRFRAVDRPKPPFDRALSKHIEQSRVPRQRGSLQPIFTRLNPLDVKLLARLDSVLLPEFGRKHDLAFAGDAGFHLGKIVSYLSAVNKWWARFQLRNATEGVPYRVTAP